MVWRNLAAVLAAADFFTVFGTGGNPLVAIRLRDGWHVGGYCELPGALTDGEAAGCVLECPVGELSCYDGQTHAVLQMDLGELRSGGAGRS